MCDMKKSLLWIALMGLSGSLSAQKADGGATEPVAVIQDGIRFCESTYPYKGGILIANFGTEELNPLNTEGKGYIAWYKDGNVRVLVPADGNLSAPKGMFERQGYLYVCDVNKIVVYHLDAPAEKPQVIRLPEGNLFVNDLASSGSMLYASVTNTDKIFRIDISDPAHPGTPQEWLSVPGPNGLLTDNGVMYVASYPADGQTQDKHVIYRIADLAKPKAEKFIRTPGQYDGIAFSSDKRSIYITNWTPAGLSKVDIRTRQEVPVQVKLDKQLIGPADITVDGQKIYIPDLPNSRVLVVKE